MSRSYEVDQVDTRQVAGVIINFLRRRLSGHDHRLRGALPCSGVERRPMPAHVAAELLPLWEHDAVGMAPVHVAGGGALAGARAEQEVETVGAHQLPEKRALPSAKYFTEGKNTGTRQRDDLPKAAFGTIQDSTKISFAESRTLGRE